MSQKKSKVLLMVAMYYIHLKNLKKHFKKLQKYQYGLDYLFNEHNEERYTTNNDINVFQEARKLLNERRTTLLLKETKEIKKKTS